MTQRCTTGIDHLWHYGNQQEWSRALDHYWEVRSVKKNIELEKEMDNLDPDRVRRLDRQGWYEFLLKEYFRWKYTSARRYARNTGFLRRYDEEHRLDELYGIMNRLLEFNKEEILEGLTFADQIAGLGTAGASGLLAVLYPQKFGTADKFVVERLREVSGLPEAHDIAKMNPDNLSLRDGVVLIRIMRRKAEENNRLFGTSDWTPRKIDQALWAYGR